MSQEFQNLMDKIALAIENRTIITTPKKTALYEKGLYNPFFSLVERNGGLICVWCGNVREEERKKRKEIIRLQVRNGLPTSKDDPKGWDAVTLKVMHSLGLKL